MMGCITLLGDCSKHCCHWPVIIPNQCSFFKKRFTHNALHLCRKGPQLTGWRSGPRGKKCCSLCQHQSFADCPVVFPGEWDLPRRVAGSSHQRGAGADDHAGLCQGELPGAFLCCEPALLGSYLKAGWPQPRSCCSQWERLQTEK